METKVAGILGALSQLEQDLDSLESSVSDMKKSITTKTNSEIESVSIKVRQSASAKAEQIVAVCIEGHAFAMDMIYLLLQKRVLMNLMKK